ncbi:MAG TPA: hypothetical protein VGK40_03590 [Verrucomicrobiae bacterium]|jgi:hypothetical protein
MNCDRCHQNAATIELTFTDPPTGRQFPQQFCASCFDEVLRPHPEVCQELKQAETEGRPAELKSLPSELIPETFQKLMRQRRAR